MRIDHQTDIDAKRRAAYPAIGDQLDILWKALSLLAGKQDLGPEANAMLAQISAVKKKYPKPTK